MVSKEPAAAEGPATPGAGAAVPAGWPGFTVARLPRILFGAGRTRELGSVVAEFGRTALVIVRGPGFTDSTEWAVLRAGLEAAGVSVAVESVSGEPSPALVDEIVARHRAARPGAARPGDARPGDARPGAARPGGTSGSGATPISVVVGIGGGSVLDTAKAVAGLLIPGNSVMDHLEESGRSCRIAVRRCRSSPCQPQPGPAPRQPRTRC